MISASVLAARGSAACPLSDGEIEMKVRALAEQGAPACDADAIIEAVWISIEHPICSH